MLATTNKNQRQKNYTSNKFNFCKYGMNSQYFLVFKFLLNSNIEALDLTK